MKNQTTINCPNCETEIDVDNVLKHQIEETIRSQFKKEQIELIKAQKDERILIDKEKADFEEKKKKENELFQERIKNETTRIKDQIEKDLKAQLTEENSERLKTMELELAEKSSKVKDLYKKEAEIAQLKREKDEMKDAIEAESQKKLNEMLHAEKSKIKKQAEEDNELKLKTLQKQLEDQIRLTNDMKRKQEQGSMQLQGEVQELAIEEWLSNSFPLDTVDEIRKGVNGADCMQIINTREHQNCGKIYYESKRSKSFQPIWIEKFKNDIRDNNANIGVLVTEVMPSDMPRMGFRDGIWICTLEEFKGLSAVLRQSLININAAVLTQENKGDKMVMLYDFLTSNEFRLQIEGIVEGFTQMQIDLMKEKNATMRLWKKREKQIDKVISNTLNMHGAIKGIAGTAIQEIKMLELEDHGE